MFSAAAVNAAVNCHGRTPFAARSAQHARHVRRYAEKRVEARGGPSEIDEAAATPSFAQARAELEEIVGRLERGEVELEEAVALWKRGEELFLLCVAKLDEAQGLVEELGRDGAVTTLPAAGLAVEQTADPSPGPDAPG